MGTSPETPSGSAPLAERLRRRYGSDVDPEISLAGAPATGSSRSSGVLGRLELRAPLATRYRVERELARGGMGAILEVWDEDLRRRLAMKVALSRRAAEPGAPRPERELAPADELDARVLARFLEEAQITGQLDHPGIVPVHELGLDEHGHVFFTMRLVRGRDLEQVFRLAAEGQEGWSRTRVLGVLLKACEALAYAHEKGVVHRDLKPANVMVGGFGEVYVMDWGLARVIGAGAPERAGEREPRVAPDRRADASGVSGEELYTMHGDVLGTPAYMAPEQARGEHATLDARADVYSMGAMLYRLLADARPYVAPGERVAGTVLVERVIAGPPTPLAELAPDVPAELVAICEQAMARAPGDRYPDMQALAEDLRAFLEQRVVRAYAHGPLAEARQWVRRNKPLAASLAAGVLALAAGLVASLVLRSQANASAALAEERRVVAEASAREAGRQARISAAVNAFLNDDLFAAVAPEHQGRDVTVREVLDLAAARLEGRFPDEPAIEAELRGTIGKSYERLGEYEPARAQLARAVALSEGDGGPLGERTIGLAADLAHTLNRLGRADESLALHEDVLARSRRVFGAGSREALNAANGLAVLLTRLGRLDEARALYEEALAGQRALLGEAHPDTLMTWSNLGLLELEAGDFARGYERLRAVVDARRASGAGRRELFDTLQKLSLASSELGRYDEAESLLREAVAIAEELLGPEHPDTAGAWDALGTLCMRRGRVAEAERALRAAVAALEASLGAEHPRTLLANNNLCVLLERQGRHDEALPLRRAVLAGQERAQGPEHDDTLGSRNNLAILLMRMRRYDEAEAELRAALEARRRALGDEHPTTIAVLENLGNVLYSRGDVEGARELVLEVLDARERVLGPEHPDTARTMINLALLEKRLGAREEAEGLLLDALERSRAVVGEEHPDVAQALRELGELAREAGRLQEAAPRFLEAAAIHRALGDDDAERGFLLHQAAYCLWTLGRHEEALEPLTEAHAARAAALGPAHAFTRTTRSFLADALLQLGRHEEAEPHALELFRLHEEAQGPDHDDTLAARARLVRLYEAWGREEDAAAWR